MNRIISRLLLCLLCFVITSHLWAERPPESEGYNFLSKEKYLSEGTELQLLPEFSGKVAFFQRLEALEPERCLEMLYTMPLPDTNGEELLLFLINNINSISTMSGLEYYSNTKGNMTLYLEDCFLVQKKGSKKELSDNSYNTLPGEVEFIIYQKDTKFGANWYEVNIDVTGDAIVFSMTNINTMRYMFFPVLGVGGIHIDLILTPRADVLELYAIAQMETAIKEIFGQKIYLPGVFDHRMSAIQGWFARQIYENPVPGQILHDN
ncbi:MAG: hypothetical protein JEY99_09315 [Spirochaetales bacterium]|nr:hypothetical protein [Spirochaetales bacterium]